MDVTTARHQRLQDSSNIMNGYEFSPFTVKDWKRPVTEDEHDSVKMMATSRPHVWAGDALSQDCVDPAPF
uniref:Uncharacterized protein n=1 Tax=Steinernema glaseri TaxID=37863 RepID=A0A1I7YN36_9BILA